MLIELKKFGNILTSREAGGEALAAFSPTLKSLDDKEKIEIDFKGVSVLTPSWADEFIGKLWIEYGERISFIDDDNPSVRDALRFAKPKLDLSKVTVFEDKLVFDEKSNNKIYSSNNVQQIFTFPYSDKDVLQILKNYQIKEIRVRPVDKLSNERLEIVIEMLNQAGIKTSD